MKTTHEIILKILLANKNHDGIRYREIYARMTDEEKEVFGNNPKSVSNVSRGISKKGLIEHAVINEFGNDIYLFSISNGGEKALEDHLNGLDVKPKKEIKSEAIDVEKAVIKPNMKTMISKDSNVKDVELNPFQQIVMHLEGIKQWIKPYLETQPQPTLKYKVGDRVVKIGGDYSITGTIVAAFTKTSGAERYVLEADNPKGLLHIYSESNLTYENNPN